MNKPLVSFLFLLFTIQLCLGQTADELRNEFFLEALQNPKGIKALVNGYKQYENDPKHRELYKIYTSSIKIFKHEEDMLKSMESELAKYSGAQRDQMITVLKTVYGLPHIPYEVSSSYFIKSYLLSFRVSIDDQLSPEQLSTVDQTIAELDRLLLLSLQTQMFDGLNITNHPDYNGIKPNFELVYQQLVLAFMHLNKDNGKTRPAWSKLLSENSAFVRIMRYGHSDSDGGLIMGMLNRYVAMIYLKSTESTILVPLKKEVQNPKYYFDYLKQYSDPYSSIPLEKDSSYYHYWQPIDKHLKGVTEVYLEAAGVYTSVAIQALKTQTGRYVSDDKTVNLIYDNDYSKFTSRQSSNNWRNDQSGFAIFGYPNYEYEIKRNQSRDNSVNDSQSIPPLNDNESRLHNWVTSNDLNYPRIEYESNDQDDTGYLASLTMSKVESRVLHKLLTENKMDGHLYLDSLSSEFNIKKIKSPKALHIATHASFLGAGLYPVTLDSINGGYQFNSTKLYLSGAHVSLNERKFFAKQMEETGAILSKYYKDGMEIIYEDIEKQEANGNKPNYVSAMWKLVEALNQKEFTERYKEEGAALKKASESFSEYDGALDINEIAKLSLSDTEIVTLSACGPQGKQQTPASLISLAGAFLGAGAKSVLGSLWPVNDESSALFMLKFYKHWLSGQSKSKSVILAKEDIRKIPGFEHPHFWGGWMLYGEQL